MVYPAKITELKRLSPHIGPDAKRVRPAAVATGA